MPAHCLRLLTWNVHKGIGGIDRRYRPERIVEALAHYAPDIAFLQEVDDGAPRSRRHRQSDLFGDAVGLPHRAFQANVALREGAYGNAILSRFSLHDIDHIDLTVPFKKRRRALLARFRIDGGTEVLLVNFHLGLAGIERRIQLRRVLGHPALRHGKSDLPVILGGDLNDVWGGLGRTVLAPAEFRSVGDHFKTFPAIFPARPLDRLYLRGDVVSHHAFAPRTALTRHASDHLPLVADLEFGGVLPTSRRVM